MTLAGRSCCCAAAENNALIPRTSASGRIDSFFIDASHACGLGAPAGLRPLLKLALLCGQFDFDDLRRTIVAHRASRIRPPTLVWPCLDHGIVRQSIDRPLAPPGA